MTGMLKKAFEEASRLPEDEQDELARLMLEEIKSERCWAESFAQSADRLKELAKGAAEDHEGGRTSPLDPDQL